ncbi:MAG: ATP-binding protein [Candidatus Omnitrophota bacterium]
MRFKIGTKIGIVFSIFFIEIALFAGLYSIIARQHEDYMLELQKQYNELELVRNLQLTLIQAAMPVNDYLIVGGDYNEKGNFNSLSAKVEELIGELDKLKFGRTEERQLLNHLKEEYTQFKKIALQIFSIPEAVGNIKVGQLMEKMDEIADDASKDAGRFYQLAQLGREELQHHQDMTKNLLNLVVSGGVLLNIILILGSLFFFARTISRPIVYLRNAALEIGKGNLDAKVDLKMKDEIGDLSFAFNNMVKDLRKTQTQLVHAEKMSALGQLSAGVAHEIKNPLAIIIQGIAYLKSFISTDVSLVDAMQRVEDSALRADKIVKDLLNFSRQAPLAFEELDITSVIEETLSLVEHQVSLKNIKIIRQFALGLPKIKADSSRLKQVFINILNNAVEAMPQGGTITISLKQLEVQPREHHLEIIFTDTGCGILEENISKAFDPFFSTKKKDGSAGLGLSVTRGIIERHNGKIMIESQIGKGTSVIISLPIA